MPQQDKPSPPSRLLRLSTQGDDDVPKAELRLASAFAILGQRDSVVLCRVVETAIELRGRQTGVLCRLGASRVQRKA